eukprot:16436004-Heterocapsa_arctica.AAC.1
MAGARRAGSEPWQEMRRGAGRRFDSGGAVSPTSVAPEGHASEARVAGRASLDMPGGAGMAVVSWQGLG